MVLQRPHEEALAEEWLGGRRPGRDVPAVYVEHNAPQGRINEMRHPAADRPDLTLVHVTHFNALFWDAGTTPTRVVEHGIVDPGPRYDGRAARARPSWSTSRRRRARVTGTDLLEPLAERAPIDVFGMGADAVGGPPSTGSTTCRRTGCTTRWRGAGCTCTRSAGPRSACR